MKKTKLREYAKGKDCQVRMISVCNHNPETTVLAHVRMAGITGTGQKAPDLLATWACSECHRIADHHPGDLAIENDFLKGVIRTIYQLIKEGKVVVR